MIPAESTFRAKDIPGEIVNRDISGYLSASTLGSIDNIMANLAKAARIVHNSRIFGHRLDSTTKTAASRETSTAANGISEKYVSISIS